MGYLAGGPALARRNLVRFVDHAAFRGVGVTVDVEYATQVADTRCMGVSSPPAPGFGHCDSVVPRPI